MISPAKEYRTKTGKISSRRLFGAWTLVLLATDVIASAAVVHLHLNFTSGHSFRKRSIFTRRTLHVDLVAEIHALGVDASTPVVTVLVEVFKIAGTLPAQLLLRVSSLGNGAKVAGQKLLSLASPFNYICSKSQHDCCYYQYCCCLQH